MWVSAERAICTLRCVKLYGYEYGYRYLIEDAPLREFGEVSIEANDATELRRIAAFILQAAERVEGPGFDHEHYRDWAKDWHDGDADLIVLRPKPGDSAPCADSFVATRPPLVRAAATGDIEAVRTLLAGGAAPSECDEDGWSALHAAASRGHADVVGALLQGGTDVDQRDDSGMTPLCNAAGPSPSPETIRLLLDAGADPNASDTKLGTTPLDRAAGYCKPEIAALLIAAGADVHWADEDGFTLLMTAADTGCESVAHLLLDAGVDPSLTSEGNTAAEVARARGHIALADLLASHGT